MNEKEKIRYLKKVTTLCLIMNTIITIVCLFVMVLSRYLDAAVIGILAGMWSTELILGYFLKRKEKESNQDLKGDQNGI